MGTWWLSRFRHCRPPVNPPAAEIQPSHAHEAFEPRPHRMGERLVRHRGVVEGRVVVGAVMDAAVGHPGIEGREVTSTAEARVTPVASSDREREPLRSVWN